MIIGFRDCIRLFGISVIVCLAVFVCTIFLNYNLDITAAEEQIAPEGRVIYEALVMTGKAVAAVSGGCLAATSLVMLLGYIRSFIDARAKELGVLKALGYSAPAISRRFLVFGAAVLAGAVPGLFFAYCYMPTFYARQNETGLLPDIRIRFHPELSAALTLLPAALFALLSMLYALSLLKKPPLQLLGKTGESRPAPRRRTGTDRPFLKELKRSTLRDQKLFAFLIGFSAFCFSSMTQMSMSMKDLSSESFSGMILTIGLLLAFLTLFLSLTGVVKANSKPIAMLKVFGYSRAECSRAILGCYRPVALAGFALGSVYQYVLLRLTVTCIFADYEGIPEFQFSLRALSISLAAFIPVYELIMHGYAGQISRMSPKSIMLE